MNQQNGDWLNVRLVIWGLIGIDALAIAGSIYLIATGHEVPNELLMLAGGATTAIGTLLTQGRTGQRQTDTPQEPVAVVGPGGGPVPVTESEPQPENSDTK